LDFGVHSVKLRIQLKKRKTSPTLPPPPPPTTTPPPTQPDKKFRKYDD